MSKSSNRKLAERRLRTAVERQGGKLIKVNGKVAMDSAEYWYGRRYLLRLRLGIDANDFDDAVDLVAAIGRAFRARSGRGGAKTGRAARDQRDKASGAV